MKTTHYRKVFKSDHLGTPDLEDFIEQGKPLSFVIKNVTQHLLIPNVKTSGVQVAGKRINANIAHFYESIKPLVLNAKNSKQVSAFAKSKFTEDWNDIAVELYIDPSVTMHKQVVGGVRIRPIQPKQKVKPSFTEANFEKAKGAKATIEQIKKAYTITNEIEKLYNEYVTKN